MNSRNRAAPPPTTTDLLASYTERIGQTMPHGLIPTDLKIQWMGQLLFGSGVALEDRPYRVQSDVDDFLQEAIEGHFAIGFWGHGIQSHAFYIQRVEPWCRVYLRIPYGGIYSDCQEQAIKLHQVLLWLPEFLREARSQCRHLKLVDSMGDGQLRVESDDGEIYECGYNASKMASKLRKMSDLFGASGTALAP
jgi:hypothetical protein